MENKQFTQITETIKALGIELKPVFKEVSELNKELEKLEKGKIGTALIQLIPRITKTARRHDIDNKVKSDNSEYTIGTNHNGLGYQVNYSSQLTDLSNDYYSNILEREQITRDILFDSDAVIDLTAIIKKSNQKTFLKVVKILKKYDLKTPFRKFKDDQINEIEVDIGDADFKIKINIENEYSTTFNIKNKEGIRKSVSISNKGGIPIFEIEKEKIEILNYLSSNKCQNLDLEEIKLLFFLTEHKESMINQIKATTTLLKGVTSDYTKEHEELNELLEPFLTLEKL